MPYNNLKESCDAYLGKYHDELRILDLKVQDPDDPYREIYQLGRRKAYEVTHAVQDAIGIPRTMGLGVQSLNGCALNDGIINGVMHRSNEELSPRVSYNLNIEQGTLHVGKVDLMLGEVEQRVSEILNDLPKGCVFDGRIATHDLLITYDTERTIYEAKLDGVETVCSTAGPRRDGGSIAFKIEGLGQLSIPFIMLDKPLSVNNVPIYGEYVCK